MRTEHISPRYVDLDAWPAAEMIAAMYEGPVSYTHLTLPTILLV